MFFFQYKMRCRGGKSRLCERTGSVLELHGPIMVESAAHCKRCVNCFRPISPRFWSAIFLRAMPVAPRIVNDLSYVTGINHACHVAWQAQYLVMLEDECCCSAHCK